MTPESVIYSADINREQWQSDSEEIVRQKAVVVGRRAAAKDVVERRQTHADLEAYEERAHDEFVDEMCMDLQECDVVYRQCDEQKQSEYVRPYINL